MTLMRGAGLVVLTPEGVRQRSDTSCPVFELRSAVRPCLSSGKLFHPVEELKSRCNIFATCVTSIHSSLNRPTFAACL